MEDPEPKSDKTIVVETEIIKDSQDNQDIKDNKENNSELWDQIGFHKPIAGFYYNITLSLLSIILSAILFGYLIGFFYPYPESLGYKDIAFGYFTLLFSLFDIGTGAVIGRFIPEVNVSNPERMIHYIQYFIWYQMFTGLVQTTIVSMYAIFIASETTMAYTIWIMLICSTTQWPGFLYCFRSVIEALQYYDKVRILNFVLDTVFQNFTNYLFLYLGRVWGEANPVVGPILGIAIGASIGSYVDDFFAMMLSVHFFQQIIKNYGVPTKRYFKAEFTWDEVKPVVIYSIKTGLPGYFNGTLQFIGFLITVSYIPQYATLMFLSIVGGSIADVIGGFGGPGGTAIYSESYMNKKPALTQYYIGQEVRFNFFIIGFWIPMVLILRQVMPNAWSALNMAQYAIAVQFMLPRLIRFSISKFLGTPGSVLYGANRPNLNILLGIIGAIADLILKYLYLMVWQLPYKIGFVGIIWLLELGYLPISMITAWIGYRYIDKKMVKIKIPWAQIIIGMGIPSFIMFIGLSLVYQFVFLTIFNQSGFFVALFPSIMCIFLVLIFGYFSMTALFGGWDTVNLDEFRKAAKMSGPSKFLIQPVYWFVEKVCLHSPLHNRFALPTDEVMKDAKDLLIVKRQNREALKEKIQNEQKNKIN
jgi:hypothetical protein